MNLLPLLVLPLVGGYLFSLIWRGTSYAVAREDGHKLYFRSIFYGVFFFLSVALIHVALFSTCNWYRDFLQVLAPVFNDQKSEIFGKESEFIVLVASLFAGPILGFVANFHEWRMPKWAANCFPEKWEWPVKLKNWYLNRAIRNDYFERMMRDSGLRQIPVIFTLESRKVYVGIVRTVETGMSGQKHVRILPLHSGYREKDTLEFVETTNYYDIYKPYLTAQAVRNDITLDDFDVVFPADKVAYCHFFDEDTYLEYLENKKKNLLAKADAVVGVANQA